MLAWLYWDPNPVAFYIPFVRHPVMWYGLFFSLGFAVGYFILISMLKRYFGNREQSVIIADKLLWYVIFGTIVGARLGDVFFYDWPMYKDNPVEIFKIWHGGLASHGGAVGVILAVSIAWIFTRRDLVGLSFIGLMDFIVVPVALAGSFIRIGNFFNQEIVGIESNVPWAVAFIHPLNGIASISRHPVQLYEASVYALIFFALIIIWHRYCDVIRSGFMTGLFLCSVFTSRFFLEFFKERQRSFIDNDSLLLTGQYLSIPFIIVGIAALFYSAQSSRVFCKNDNSKIKH